MHHTKTAFRHIDLSYLDLMTEGDAEVRQTMLAMLGEELPAEIEKMRLAWRGGDMAALKALSHKMKSTLAFVGSEAMTGANRAIEQAAMGHASLDGLAGHFEALEQPLEGVLAELEEAAAA